jgi:hypothetical protein
MAFLVNQTAAKNFTYLVDAIGELVATVFNVDHGVPMHNIAAVHISYSTHQSACDFIGRQSTTAGCIPG